MNASFSRRNIHNIVYASGSKERFVFPIGRYFLLHVKILLFLLHETNTTFMQKVEKLKSKKRCEA
jgi:hypothetical protein